MNVFSISEGRKKLGELVKMVKYQHRTIALGSHGKPEALLIACPADSDDLNITAVNAASSSFDFLKDEPDLYNVKDLRKRYV